MYATNSLEVSRTKLLPQVIDHRAETTPNLLYAEYPVSLTSYNQGFCKFTYKDLANAINGIAWWLLNSLGPGKFETLAYIGPNDIRIPALILGAVKAGYVIFLPSPRNSIPAQFHLFIQTQCSTLVTSNPQLPAVSAILESPNHKLRSLEVPSVEKLVGEVWPHFKYEKIYQNVHMEPLCMVHTSGSTGMPKTLVMTHAWTMGNVEMMAKGAPLGFVNLCKLWQGNRVFAVFPPFHAMYIGAFLINAITFGTVMIAPVAAAIPTAEGMVDALAQTPFDAAFILPSIVRELSQSPRLLDHCIKHLERIFFAGGDLPQEVGNVVASKIQLANHYGSSETGLLSLLVPEDDSKRDWRDWKYLQFDESLGCDFRQYNDNEFELYIKNDSAVARYQPVFGMFPGATEYRTRDLFVRHPSKRDLWKWSARADDIIVLLTGEKTNPISLEQHVLSQNTTILGLLVAGSQRFQTALLVHPVRELLTLSDKAAFIENIWPSIEEANKLCPTHARIAKSHILFTTPSKPMLFSGKGTIQRAATLSLYSSELDKLYDDADKMLSSPPLGGSKIDLVMENSQIIRNYIKQTISAITNWNDFRDSDDFFVLGMDSLQAIMTVRKFRLDLALPSFSPSTIYTNPSVSTLSNAMVELSGAQKTSQVSEKQYRKRTTSEIIEEYEHLINQIPVIGKIPRTSKDKYLVLTGSTGALGSYILHALLADPTVVHVYCLNRDVSSEYQVKRNKISGLPTHQPASRVTYLSADLSKPLLGLQSSIYQKLQATATHIIHNAWPVNFKLSTQAFRPQFSGLVNLIAFVATSKISVHLMFISSIGSIINTNPTGYAESKRISEILLTYASEVFVSSAPCFSIVRVGQIAGAVNYQGLWNISEWFPSLILSSMHLGIIPNSLGAFLGNIDWVPIDVLAKVLLELAFSENNNKRTSLFHPLNPRSITYEAILPAIITAISRYTENSKSLVPVSPTEWIEKVRKDIEKLAGPDSQEGSLEILLKLNPAAKLLGFYSTMLSIHENDIIEEKYVGEMKAGLTQALAISRQLKELEAIKEEWMSKWLGEWISAVKGIGPGN